MVYHLQEVTEDTPPSTPPPQPPTTTQKAAAAATTTTTTNYVTNYTQTHPEDVTNTFPIPADKQKTIPSYVIQDEETRDFEQSTKKWIPTLY